MNTPRDVLIYYSLLCHGDWDKTLDMVRSHDPLPPADKVSAAVAPYRNRTITVLDEAYPNWLSRLIRAPLVYFYKGDISLLQNRDRLVAVTGCPNPEDTYPISKTKEIVAKATEAGAVVITGLSNGIQHAALEAALSKGPAIALLTHGHNRVYPTESKDLQALVSAKGLALSPFGDNEPPSPAALRERNCLLGQVAKLLFVASCRPQDGIMMTIALALREGRDIGCLPCRAGEEIINNEFIRDGAAIIESGEDLIYELGLNRPRPSEGSE